MSARPGNRPSPAIICLAISAAQSAAVSQNSQLVAVPGADHRIQLFNGNTLEPRQTLTGPAARTTALVFSSNSKLLAGGSEDGVVTLWSLKDGARLRSFVPGRDE